MTLEEKIKNYEKAKELGIEVPELKTDELDRIYNGTGGSSMPDAVRAFLDKLSKVLQPAVCQHDCRFYFGDGTFADFVDANEQLYKSGKICACERYSWWHIRRYLEIRKAKIASRLCQDFGWTFYLEAIAERKAHENG